MTIPTDADTSQQAGRGVRILAEHGIDLGDFATYQDRLPTRGYVVYVMIRADGRALYIGQTRQPRSRIHAHRRKKPWWPEVRALELHSVADEVAARHLEVDLHGQRRPLHSQVRSHELFRLQSLSNGGPTSAHRSPAPSVGGGLRKYIEPAVAFRVSVLTDLRLSVLARLVDAWLHSIEDGEVPPASTAAAALGCATEDVLAAYDELLAVGKLRSEERHKAHGEAP